MALTDIEIDDLAREIAELVPERIEVPPDSRRRFVSRTVRQVVRQKVEEEYTEEVRNQLHTAFVVFVVGVPVTLQFWEERPILGALLALLTIVIAGVFFFSTKPVKRTRTVDRDVEVDVERPEEVEELVTEEERDAALIDVDLRRFQLELVNCPVGEHRVFVDASGTAQETELRVVAPADTDGARRALQAYAELVAHPVRAFLDPSGPKSVVDSAVEEPIVPLQGLERELWNALRACSEALGARTSSSVSLPLVRLEDLQPVGRLVRLHGPPGDVASLSGLRTRVEHLATFRPGALSDDYRRALSAIDAHLATLADSRETALRRVLAVACTNLGQTFHYSAFNFFCPRCNGPAIRDVASRSYSVQESSVSDPLSLSVNTRCEYDLDTANWVCRSCGGVTPTPIPIHRVLDELILPTYDRLMEENKNERIQTYHEARVHDLEYSNAMQTELEALFQKNRTEVELLLQEQGRISSMAQGEEEAIQGLRRVQTAYKVEQSSLVASMVAEHAAIVGAIAKSRRVAEDGLAQSFEKERAMMTAEMQRCSRAKRIEDEQRDAVFRQMSTSLSSIEVSSRQTARNTGVIANNTTVMVGQLGRIEENTAVSAQNSTRMVALQEQNNACQAAIFTQLGGERKPGFFDVGGHIGNAFDSVTSGVLGEDQIARERRRNSRNID